MLAAAAGWAWAGLLVAFFVSATALTRWRAEEKFRRTERSVPPGGERRAVQVIANGGVFVLLALAAQPGGDERWAAGALGALAAASADTWSTEIGTPLGGSPRSILTLRAVPTGMSGGVTITGFAAAIAGAALIAALGAAVLEVRVVPLAVAAVAGGLAGCVADSVIGASVQAKRWCDRCQEWTERRVHPCGARTQHRSGIYWMTNDLVNLGATVVGGGVAMAVASAWVR